MLDWREPGPGPVLTQLPTTVLLFIPVNYCSHWWSHVGVGSLNPLHCFPGPLVICRKTMLKLTLPLPPPWKDNLYCRWCIIHTAILQELEVLSLACHTTTDLKLQFHPSHPNLKPSTLPLIVNVQGGPKTGPFIQVCNSCIWWRGKAVHISECLVLYLEWD